MPRKRGDAALHRTMRKLLDQLHSESTGEAAAGLVGAESMRSNRSYNLTLLHFDEMVAATLLCEPWVRGFRRVSFRSLGRKGELTLDKLAREAVLDFLLAAGVDGSY